ncbi:MAG: leucine-rich repeat domain-containing protein [Prevotellaceae bacterium]|jgi:hypothetical protein|nr:leucine-rich repeat domain-containing protein [Prevotellaceae bacterium]
MPDNFVRLLKYKGSDSIVAIPENFGRRKVLEISIAAFKNDTNLISVSIPNTVRSISSEAFKGCTALKSVSFSNQLQLIENEAFADCVSLTSINLPDSVKQIENRAFGRCTALQRVVMNSNTKVDNYAFDACNSLRYPTGSPKVDWIITYTREYYSRKETSLKFLTDMFRERFYPFYESLFGDNNSKTYDQIRGEITGKHDNAFVALANLSRFHVENIKPTYNGLPSKFTNELGTKPDGKILIVQYWPHSFEIDFSAIACLPKRYIPFYFSEIQYIVYVTYKPAKTVYYTNGGAITETKAFVDVYKLNNSNSFTLLKNIGSRNSRPAPIQTMSTDITMWLTYSNMADMVNQAIEYINVLAEK